MYYKPLFFYTLFMSTIISPFIKRLEQVEKALPRVAKNIILENSDYIISVLQDNQLSKGLDSKQKIVGYYSEKTQNFYKDPSKKPRTKKTPNTPYNFEWYGELFDSMNLKVDFNSYEFEIISSTGKIEYLEDIYERKLGTLSEQNNYIINFELLLPKLVEYILTESISGLV